MAKRTLRVATYNIKNGLDLDREKTDNAKLAKACQELDADILALQEVDRRRVRSRFRRQSELVARRTGMKQAFGRTRRRDLIGGYGNALLVRGSISDLALWDLPITPGHEARGAILATLEVDGLRCSVAATHLQNRREEWPDHEAPEQLRAVLAALKTRPGPRLLMGDMNLRERIALPIIEEAGFVAAEHGPTWPAPEPEHSIDWIAVDGFEIVDAEVVHLAVSDHRAVVATLRVR